MTLSIRWDSSDTLYISGTAGQYYVHWPLEISSNTSTAVNVSVWLYDANNVEIVSQNYSGIPVSSSYSKFNPAVLVPDSYFPPGAWTLKALIYTDTVPIETPRTITKAIGSGGSNLKYVFLAGILFLLIGGKLK